MSAPTEQHSPHSPADLETVFLLPTSLNADCTAPHTLGQIGYFISYFVHWNILSLCYLPLLSLCYLSITPLTSWPLSILASLLSLLLAQQLRAH